MRRRAYRVFAAVLALIATPTLAGTDAWLAVGDAGLRHDIQLLADSGNLPLTTTSWPIPTTDVVRAIAGIKDRSRLSTSQSAALARIERKIAAQTSDDWSSEARLSGAAKPILLRTFADSPREGGELAVAFAQAGEHFSGRLQLTVAVDPDDNQTVRLDGSHLTAQWGNWLFSAGALDRWWGPGWDGSLILSNNARPVPALALDRASSAPFRSPWLSWIGPWRLSTFMGAMETHRQDRDHPLLFGMRITFSPLGNLRIGSVHPFRNLELGLERTAQWCAAGLPCGAQAFWNVFAGHDNSGENVDPQDEPGNQLAGWTLRWASPYDRFPVAFYRQKTGETIDLHSPLPRRTLDLYGLEVWGGTSGGLTWRAHAEYADTACSATAGQSVPAFDCAYNNGLFNVEGYRYRGRVMGHSADGDARVYSMGLLLARPDSVTGSVTLRFAELNRGGQVPDTRNGVSDRPVDLWNIETALQIPRGRSDLRFGAGFDRAKDDLTGRNESAARAFAEWRQRF